MTTTANDIITVCSPEDALNIAGAYYVEVNKKTNEMLDLLRKEQSNSINVMIRASFGIAAAMFKSAFFEALSQTCVAASSGYALHDFNSTEEKLNSKMTSLDNSKKNIDEKLKTVTDSSDKQKLLDQKKNLEKSIEKYRSDITTKQSKSQQKATIGQTLSQGLFAIPKGLQEALQQRTNAVKAVSEQTQQQFGSCYDKSLQTLKGFLDINYLAGVVALASIQLR